MYWLLESTVKIKKKVGKTEKIKNVFHEKFDQNDGIEVITI